MNKLESGLYIISSFSTEWFSITCIARGEFFISILCCIHQNNHIEKENCILLHDSLKMIEIAFHIVLFEYERKKMQWYENWHYHDAKAKYPERGKKKTWKFFNKQYWYSERELHIHVVTSNAFFMKSMAFSYSSKNKPLFRTSSISYFLNVTTESWQRSTFLIKAVNKDLLKWCLAFFFHL